MGFGNIHAEENIEMIFVMIIQLIGVAVFSYIIGTLFSIKRQETPFQVIKAKKDGIENFLYTLSAAHPAILPSEIIKEAQANLEVAYMHDTESIFNKSVLMEQLKPQLRKQLAHRLFIKRYIDFQDFFENEEVKFYANEKFVREIFSEFKYEIYEPRQTIVNRGEKFK